MLEIDDLHKRFGDPADPTIALDGCTFTVTPGRMLGFLGRNGAGKTTTMRAIFGLLRPDRGEVRWHGRPVGGDTRARFGYMPEERGLYPKMTAMAQLIYFGRLHGMGAAEASTEAERWLEELDLGPRKDDNVDELSQGNQQRVQLAAALMHRPELLVLDEPFNGLDPVAAATMSRVLTERVAAGAAVVFSSHQLNVVEDLCEDVAIIDDGRVVLTGQVADLRSDAPYRIVELDLTAAQADALADLDGVLDSGYDNGHHVLQVTRDADIRALLATVDAADVDHFVYTTPSLTRLFTEAIAR